MAWTLKGLLDDAGVEAEIRGDAPVSGLAYDSRRVKAGDLFCCIPGEHVDGHEFAGVAVDIGARALLVERFVKPNVPQAKVTRSRDVLGFVADSFYERPSSELTVAGVTGTNGKTTITYLLGSIAESAGSPAGTMGTISARYGGIEEPSARTTPEAPDVQALLKRMRDAGVAFVAMEATSDGLIAGRLLGTRFQSVGFTNLTQDHLNTHGTMEAYFAAKATLFSPTYAPRAVINTDDAYGRTLVEMVRDELEVLTYGSDGDIAVLSSDLRLDGSRVTLRTPAGEAEYRSALVGPYNVSNCMCAIGLALHCGISLGAAVHGIEALASVPGRLERVEAGQTFLALVDYAHTPDALEQALGACRALTEASSGGRVIVVFGCGGDRDRAKRPQMGAIASRLADVTFITSDNPRSEDPPSIVAEIEAGTSAGDVRTIVDRREAIGEALRSAKGGDVVLVAGKGHEQGQQFADHTIPFDDRTVVRELLEELVCPD